MKGGLAMGVTPGTRDASSESRILSGATLGNAMGEGIAHS
jgi:hypothetical protein